MYLNFVSLKCVGPSDVVFVPVNCCIVVMFVPSFACSFINLILCLYYSMLNRPYGSSNL